MTPYHIFQTVTVHIMESVYQSGLFRDYGCIHLLHKPTDYERTSRDSLQLKCFRGGGFGFSYRGYHAKSPKSGIRKGELMHERHPPKSAKNLRKRYCFSNFVKK